MLFQSGFGVTHGESNVSGGMQDVGGNHQIVASRLDPLSYQRLLHVKGLISQIRMLCCIHAFSIAQKGIGDIAITILFDRCLVRLQHP